MLLKVVTYRRRRVSSNLKRSDPHLVPPKKGEANTTVTPPSLLSLKLINIDLICRDAEGDTMAASNARKDVSSLTVEKVNKNTPTCESL